MMNPQQFADFSTLLDHVFQHSEFYQNKFRAVGLERGDIRTPEDLPKIPFSDKGDLRNAYPLKLMSVPENQIVRIHSSSGTTGTPVIIPYTRGDIQAWAIMFERCYQMAGVTNLDRIQITPGYGLWTAGIGFQAGAERLGAMAVPMGPGNTEKQLQMMIDLKTTVLTATSSYALLLTEEVQRRGLLDKIHLRKGIIGSERWGDKMWNTIQDGLGIQLYDIYGLTEIYGPGISVSCDAKEGLHYWDDYLYFEVIDPETGANVPEGQLGELVITTLRKEGAPLLRYRTHDLTRLIPGKCPCGCAYPRHDRVLGRTDDMTKVKGVNIFPGQIDQVLKGIDGCTSEYQVVIDHVDGKDHMLLRFETKQTSCLDELEALVQRTFKTRIGITVGTEALAVGSLPRSEKKSTRIIDNRFH